MPSAEPVPSFCDFADLYAAWVRRLPEDATVVEVGSWLGASAVQWAEEARRAQRATRLICIDTFAGIADENFRDNEDGREMRRQQDVCLAAYGSLRPAFDRHVAPYGAQVEGRTQDSLTAAATFARESVDALFLDDDHTAAHVTRELDAWWPAVTPGGWVAGHDYDWPSVAGAVEAFAATRRLPVVQVSQRCWQLLKPGPVSWTVPPAARKALVAVCCNERSVYRQTADSLVRLGWGLRVAKACKAADFVDLAFTWVDQALTVDGLRELALRHALRAHYSHLIFLDADMTWPPDVLARLVRHHDRGVVSGLYHLKTWPHWPVAFTSGTWNARDQVFDYTHDVEVTDDAAELRPEALVGLGCAIVPTVLGYLLDTPWFHYRTNARMGLVAITEDVPFCEAVRAAGCPIWLDPTIACHHLGVQAVGSPHYTRARYDVAWAETEQAPPWPHQVAAPREKAGRR